MNKKKLLISSCFIGENVKYNGGNNLLQSLELIKEKYELFPVCPEVFGGMSIPRIPCEIISHNPLKIKNKDGVEMTKNFVDGANSTLNIAKYYDIELALLKANSPSCGKDKVYDGTFTSTLIDGSGITSQILMNNGIKVYDETQIDLLLED